MGVIGPGLYDDDIAADIGAAYRELIGDGVPAEEATDRLLRDWAEVVDDPEESLPFWLALADTQSQLGRLETRVRDRALAIIADGSDLARLRDVPALARARRPVLERLAERLRRPQRPPTRVRPRFRSVSPVEAGDVFAYALPGSGEAWLRAVAVHGDERDSYPTVEVLGAGQDQPPSDLARAPALPGLPAAAEPWPDLVSLIRDRRDADPSDGIRVVARGVPITRRRTVPATMIRWVELPDILRRHFGLG